MLAATSVSENDPYHNRWVELACLIDPPPSRSACLAFEIGWKLIRTEALMPPAHKVILSCLLGNGV